MEGGGAMQPWLRFSLLSMLLMCGCVPQPRASIVPDAPATLVATTLTSQPLQPGGCSGQFVAHTLPVTIGSDPASARLFASNGTGVAAGDLDHDGDLDLVFADLEAHSTILWNQGALQFRPESLAALRTRSVAVVDVDGDGLLDITFTQRGAGVSFWQNTGQEQNRFARQTLPGVRVAAYTHAWADLGGDQRLDLVTASYDTELSRNNPNSMLAPQAGGVVVYIQRDDGFVPYMLADQAQALAIALTDLNGDQHTDILIGNDFDLPDQAWLWQLDGWQPAHPFSETSHSTMSFDLGDIDNNGTLDLFATDMKPTTTAVETLAKWLPVMASMPQQHDPNDPQVMENTLQMQLPNGGWQNQAFERGVDASGWSWSGKFGDLDQDGWLDLYVANGMIAEELFGHLPGYELVEQNYAFHNTGYGYFREAADWGLNTTSSGRGMIQADLDRDGDLDIVVSNLRSPAQLFENQLCGGHGLTIRLEWSASPNRSAIGSLLRLETTMGTYLRDIRATSGYLSGDAATAHFGIPTGAIIKRLVVVWPDGAHSSIPPFSVQTDTIIQR